MSKLILGLVAIGFVLTQVAKDDAIKQDRKRIILRQLPGVVAVDVVSARNPTHRIVHLRNRHFVSKTMYAANLRANSDEPLTDDQIDKAYEQLLKEVELVQLAIGTARDRPFLTLVAWTILMCDEAFWSFVCQHRGRVMGRFFALVVFVVTTASAASVCGDDSALFDRIRKAKETYERDSSELRNDVLMRLRRAEDTARQTGNKALLDKIKSEADLLESRGTPPSVISTRDYLRKLRKVRETLEVAYAESIKALIRTGMDDKAETIEKEMADFQIAARIFQGKHYAVVKSQLPWREAKLACEREGGHLAVVNSEAENKFLIEVLRAEGVSSALIGATDERREGSWFWIDGRRVAYSNWDRNTGNRTIGVPTASGARCCRPSGA